MTLNLPGERVCGVGRKIREIRNYMYNVKLNTRITAYICISKANEPGSKVYTDNSRSICMIHVVLSSTAWARPITGSAK